MGDQSARRGREATVEAILDAAEELFVARGYTAVTVREIAAQAGVSHALVHRYLGPKEEIYKAMLRRNEESVRDAAAGSDDLGEASRLMLREALKRPRYLRLLAHSALHGLAYEHTDRRFVSLERLIELAEAAAPPSDGDPATPSPRLIMASFVALLIGWVSMGDWLLKAAGLEDLSQDEFVAAMERLVLDVERLYFPAEE